MSPAQERKLVDLVDELDGVVELLEGRPLQEQEQLLECLNAATTAVVTAINLIDNVRLTGRT